MRVSPLMRVGGGTELYGQEEALTGENNGVFRQDSN